MSDTRAEPVAPAYEGATALGLRTDVPHVWCAKPGGELVPVVEHPGGCYTCRDFGELLVPALHSQSASAIRSRITDDFMKYETPE